jgi:hypothetical protein
LGGSNCACAGNDYEHVGINAEEKSAGFRAAWIVVFNGNNQLLIEADPISF